jgi:hypothetical protein
VHIHLRLTEARKFTKYLFSVIRIASEIEIK